MVAMIINQSILIQHHRKTFNKTCQVSETWQVYLSGI
jgi:hypothetical protein